MLQWDKLGPINRKKRIGSFYAERVDAKLEEYVSQRNQET